MVQNLHFVCFCTSIWFQLLKSAEMLKKTQSVFGNKMFVGGCKMTNKLQNVKSQIKLSPVPSNPSKALS